MVATGQLKALSDWQTERNPLNVAVIGKAGEETSEFSKAAFRAIIQGVDGADPKDDKLNIDALFEELADVRAMTLLMEEHFHRRIDNTRVMEKLSHKQAWLKLIRYAPV